MKVGLIMDPMASIKIHKDSTFAMALAAQARAWPLYYMELGSLYLAAGVARAVARPLTVRDDSLDWYTLDDAVDLAIADLDVVLMRKDPPFDNEYLYATHILSIAENQGAMVVNRPQALRDANEKLASTWFPQCTPPTLVSSDGMRLRRFLEEQGDIILKPLDAMGGASIFRVRTDDPNISVILETLTHHNRRYIMAQRFIPEISAGDKRILLIDGDPVPYALARIPAPGETRGNLAAGGRGVGVALTPRDRWICQQVGPTLKALGLVFVGLDVIGDYLTEINVTSPTCIRELDALYHLDIAGMLMDVIASKIPR